MAIDLRKMGYNCGEYDTGKSNSITDVNGVMVGHSTIIKGEGTLVPGQGPVRTGITVVLPHNGNLFRQKVRAGCFVANGFGKSTGINQILETGLIESPIAITNTLSVGIVFDAIIDYSIKESPEIGIKTGSVNPVVTECFDGYLNDIQGRHVKHKHVQEAIKDAKQNHSVKEGNVGAGTGMQVFGLKSGVGTSSRIIKLSTTGNDYTIGVLVVPNYGYFKDFTFYSHKMVEVLKKEKYFPKKTKTLKLLNNTNSNSTPMSLS